MPWLTDASPAISEATSRLASENDGSRDTEDLFASVDEDEGELEEDEIVLEDGFVYWTRLDACIST